MAVQPDLGAYENRYRLVYAAGGLHWNDPSPNPFLQEIANSLPIGSQCVEFGCGEGYQTRLLASCGHSALGIDLSPTAIKRAWQNTPDGMQVRYEIGDVTDTNSVQLKESYYDLAVDIRCLHMMANQTDRDNYLKLVWTSLKPKALFYVQNGLDLSEICPQTPEEASQVEQLRQLRDQPGGTELLMTIRTRAGQKRIRLPLCPKGKLQTLEGYIKELNRSGFGIVSTKLNNEPQSPYEAVIVAQRKNA